MMKRVAALIALCKGLWLFSPSEYEALAQAARERNVEGHGNNRDGLCGSLQSLD
jgi:hypothetical protein